ncbi:MAG: hypothetical protein ACFN1I_06185, partial [Selenomonas artemidis]
GANGTAVHKRFLETTPPRLCVALLQEPYDGVLTSSHLVRYRAAPPLRVMLGVARAHTIAAPG